MKHKPRKSVEKGYSFRFTCDKKRAFPTESEALAAADHQMLQFMELNLTVYQCHICGQWHLTRQVKSNESQ